MRSTLPSMFTAKEKVEDMRYLEELYTMYLYIVQQLERWETHHFVWTERYFDPTQPIPTQEEAVEKFKAHVPVLEKEMEEIKQKIATHDYAPLELRRQASLKRLGKESAYY